MYKAYKYRLYPTNKQAELLEKQFGCVRFVYNYFLEYRQKEFSKGNKVGYLHTSKELTRLKKTKEFEWLNECYAQYLQMSLRNLDTAYTNFFKKRSNYPQFKSKKRGRDSFTCPQKVRIEEGKLHIGNFREGIKVKQHREIPEEGLIKSATVSKKAGKYFVSVLVDDGKEAPEKVEINTSVGLDVGLTHLVITSDGKKYENPKYLRKSEKRLAKAQRKLSKKKKGSNNRKKAVLRVQRLHEKVSNQRQDYLHKVSNEITNRYDAIGVEDLNVSGMIKNRNLSKAISDVGWSNFLNMVAYKCEWRGKTLNTIDRWFPSSQICNSCGKSTGKKPLHIREFTCPNCEVTHDRDINAAKNIRDYALGQKMTFSTVGNTGIYACGDTSNGEDVKSSSYVSLKQEISS